MANFGTTFERLELKYFITEDLADEIRRAIQPYCNRDPFTPDEGPGYRIHNIYLDTPNLLFHRTWLRGDADRIKLRVRTYTDDGSGPAFMEVKRKIVDVIAKSRVQVPNGQIKAASLGLCPPAKQNPENQQLLDRFAYFVARTGAEPQLAVRYRREAWASQYDRYARVTFDRRVEVRRLDGWNHAPTSRWHEVDESWLFDGLRSPTILELKCEVQRPSWMQTLIDRFLLNKSGFSKYGDGMNLFYRRLFYEDTKDLERAPYV